MRGRWWSDMGLATFRLLAAIVTCAVLAGWLVAAEEPEAKDEHGITTGAPAETGGEAHDDAAAHGDHHGDPYDLSHQNAGPQLEDPSEFRKDLAIWTFVVFLCLLAVLGKFAWRPVVEGLDRRERTIAAMIDEAKKSADEAAAQLRRYEEKLAAASEEAAQLIAQARRDAESVKEQIVAQAQEAASRERERAVQEIDVARQAALEDLTARSVDLAVVMARRIVQRQIQVEDQARLIREALDELPNSN